MAWWRHSRIVQAVAVLILLWTGADLINPSLCALDREQERLVIVSDAADATVDAVIGAALPTAPDASHVDDCFCCSHCVEVTALVTRPRSAPASRKVDSLVLPEPRLFGAQLYHPPLV